jgi:replication factor A1
VYKRQEVDGTIIEVREGSGLIFRCPLCNRALATGNCSIHGSQEGSPDLRAKVVLDDGTGVLFAVLNTEITEDIIGLSVNECIGRFESDEKRLMDLLSEKLLGRNYIMRGNVIKDDFGSTMLPSAISASALEYMPKVKELLSNLEGW